MIGARTDNFRPHATMALAVAPRFTTWATVETTDGAPPYVTGIGKVASTAGALAGLLDAVGPDYVAVVQINGAAFAAGLATMAALGADAFVADAEVVGAFNGSGSTVTRGIQVRGRVQRVAVELAILVDALRHDEVDGDGSAWSPRIDVEGLS